MDSAMPPEQDAPPRSRYRVVAHWQSGLLAGARLRPEGWIGPDLIVLANDCAEERFPLDTVVVVPQQRRARWRAAGLLGP